MSQKLFAWITLFAGLSLSTVAAFYSIIGLSMIFSGAFWSVVIMASIMEISKLVSVSWLYRYRHLASATVKLYLYIATFILMLITSLGIFGYLTRAHVETENMVINAQSGLTLVQQKETTLVQQREQINTELTALTQQSNQLISQLGNAARFGGSSGAVRVQRETSIRREALLKSLSTTNEQLNAIQQEKASIQAATNTATADVGPLRYVARAIYKKDDIETIQMAVVWLTGILMVVFDPMAIMLLIAANILFTKVQTIPQIFDIPTPKQKRVIKRKERKSKNVKKSFIKNDAIPLIDIEPTSNTSNTDIPSSSSSISDVPKSLQ